MIALRRHKPLCIFFILIIVLIWLCLFQYIKNHNDIPWKQDTTSLWPEETVATFADYKNVTLFLKSHPVSPPLSGMITPLMTSSNAIKLQLLNSFIDYYKSLFPETKRLPGFKNPCWAVHISPQGTSQSTNTSTGEHSTHEERKLSDVTCLPYFFLLGYPKCGTSSLYELLKSHQDFAPGSVKEPAWWGPSHVSMEKPLSFIADYVHMFEPATAKILQFPVSAVLGDCSSSTSFMIPFGDNVNSTFTDAIPYMFSSLFPRAKFIVTMRDPVDRMCSQFYYEGMNRCPKMFLQNLKAKTLNQTVHIHLEAYRTCMRLLKDEHLCAFHYYRWVDPVHPCLLFQLHISMYYHSLYHWLHYFPREQFLFLKMDDLGKSPINTALKMYKFLDLSELNSEGWEKLKAAREIRSNENFVFHGYGARCRDKAMWNDTANALVDFYLPFNRKLVDLLHDERFAWN